MVGHSAQIKRTNNTNDTIGTNIEMSDLCTNHNPSSAQPFIPQNGEYSLGGGGNSCYACLSCEPNNMDSGSGCEQGFWGNCVSGTGNHPTYHRTSYNADKDACCKSGGATTMGNLTCDPKYRNGADSQDCSGTFSNICMGSALKSTSCATWGNNNKNTYNTRVSTYCDKNLSDSWCRDKMVAIGGIDTTVADYCNLHPTDVFCGCYTALAASSSESINAESAAVLARPECYVKTCSSGQAYMTTDMRGNRTCPSVNLCNNVINLNGNTKVALTGVNQSCTQSQSQGTTGAAPATAVTTNSTDNSILGKIKAKFNEFNANMQYLIMFVIVLLFALGIGGLVMLGDSSAEDADKHTMELFAKYNAMQAK